MLARAKEQLVLGLLWMMLPAVPQEPQSGEQIVLPEEQYMTAQMDSQI